MRTKLLYMDDSYLKEFGAQVLEVNGERRAVMLDQTLFYPQGGGQPCDTGKIVVKGAEGSDGSGAEYVVKEVKKEAGEVWHYLDRQPTFAAGASVHGTIDWARRYAHMRMHTAAHVLAGGFMARQGALITGNQIGTEQTRFDFALDNFDRELMERMVAQANAKLAEGLEIKIYTLPREEALKIPGIVKLANALPPAISELRIVDIGGFEVQADGGTHVKNTNECGRIVITKMENKGKDNRRIYFTLQ
ncbi:MAG: alanyl-tRNA editing protein AlaXM [Candidatus Burarchaeum sp.]|nr:alanyl-tRNA editing protein AlaXM [Candidatus Burarchaeum sp.]MDO8339175.1 alanyl-tRNA editing protein AlaXM [Candidatus Burarchaeum sp.]